MAEEERIYTIPLRKKWLKVPRWKRAKRSIRFTRSFLERHMKSENVKIGNSINKYIMGGGMKHPPGKVKIHTIKEGDVVKAELIGVPFKKEVKEGKKLLGKVSSKEEKKGKEAVTEEKEKTKKAIEHIESKDNKRLEKLEKPKEDEKFLDKEKAQMIGERKIMRKSEKPHHEGKQEKKKE